MKQRLSFDVVKILIIFIVLLAAAIAGLKVSESDHGFIDPPKCPGVHLCKDGKIVEGY